MGAAHNLDTNTEAEIQLHHTADEDASQYLPASFGSRFIALTIDGFVYSGANAIVSKLPSALGSTLNPKSGVGMTYALIASFFCMAVVYYFPLYLNGQTLGKKLMKIQLVNADYSPDLSFPKILGREIIGRIIATFSIYGYLSARGPEGLGWHDRMFKTRVVSKR